MKEVVDEYAQLGGDPGALGAKLIHAFGGLAGALLA